MQSYFAVLAPDAFDDLIQQVGYSRTLELLDEMREAIASTFPECEGLRANRTSVEFTARCPSASAASELFGRIRDHLHRMCAGPGRGLIGTVCVAAAPFYGGISQSVINRAEGRLREAQRAGWPIAFDDAASGKPDDDQLMEDLPAAICGNELTLLYQPKLRARGGALAGAEGLVRWRHPVRGAVPPDLFIPLAERSGAIRALTAWVIDRAVADQARLAATGIDVPLHVNISASLVADSRFVDDALARLGPAAGRIGFEITETAMLGDPEGALASLQRLAAAGVRLSIDDYGSGFSSLAYLQRLPVDELKIDRMFVERLTSGARDPLLVRSTIDLAHALEMEVTAEGVQCAATLALLQVMRCDLVQGFFLAPPLSLDGLIDFARDSEQRPVAARPATLRERVEARRRATGDKAA